MITTRRGFIATAVTGNVASAFRRTRVRLKPETAESDRVVRNGRLKQSVTRWPYRSIPLPDFCRAVADVGLTAIDLLDEADWSVVRQFGLTCSMAYAGGGSIADGLNVKANHDAIVRNFERTIPRAAALQVPNVITFFGNRRGM